MNPGHNPYDDTDTRWVSVAVPSRRLPELGMPLRALLLDLLRTDMNLGHATSVSAIRAQH
jgi:hypothetical protein